MNAARALLDLLAIVALAIYLVVMGEHKALPDGLVWHGGTVRLGNAKATS